MCSRRTVGWVLTLATAGIAWISPCGPRTVQAQSARAGESALVSTRGSVVDTGGAPVAGAEVHLCDEYLPPDYYYKKERHKLLATTKTDERGAYSFRDIPIGDHADPAARPALRSSRFGAAPIRAQPPRWYVVVTAPDRGIEYRRPATDEERANLRIVMIPDASVTGRILDESGKPLADVPVTAWFYPLGTRNQDSAVSNLISYSPIRPQAKTDGEGRFRITGLPPEHEILLWIEHAPYAHEHAYAATTRTPQPDVREGRVRGKRPGGGVDWEPMRVHTGDVPIVLRLGWNLKGRVTSAETGEPIVSATVNLNFYNHSSPTMTDAEGRYEFTGIGQSLHTLSVRPPRASQSPRTFPRPVLRDGRMVVPPPEPGPVARDIAVRFTPEERNREIDVTLPLGHFIMGTVVDGSNNSPMRGAGVMDAALEVDPTDDQGVDRLLAPDTATTQVDGKFRLLVPLGNRTIRLFNPTFRGREASQDRSSPRTRISADDLPDQYRWKPDEREEITQQLEVAEGRPTPELRFSVYKGLKVTGTVTDHEGRPVEAADISTFDPFLRPVGNAMAKTDANGRFELFGLPVLPSQRLRIVHSERKLVGRIDVDGVTLDGNKLPVRRSVKADAVVKPAGRVVGRVVDSDGPVAGARVILQEVLADGSKELAPHGGGWAQSGRDGRFVIELVEPACEYAVRIETKPPYEERRAYPRFKLEPAETRELPDLTLRKAQE